MQEHADFNKFFKFVYKIELSKSKACDGFKVTFTFQYLNRAQHYSCIALEVYSGGVRFDPLSTI